jgi:HSP20 family protein
MSSSTPLENSVTVAAPVDIYENQDELLILVDVPGATAQDIGVRLEKNLIAISAKRPATTEGSAFTYERSFMVPNTIDGERITADVKAGVLEIHMPKREETKPRSIQVRASN